MPQRSVATNFTFEQQRTEINLLAADFWNHKTGVDGASSTYLKHNGSNDFTGGTLNVPNAFTISSNSGNGTVTIAGNLQVDGTTTTVNTATMDVVDKNITIAKGSANDAAADGAGITIDSATDITLNFVDANDAWVSSIGVEATTFLKGPYGQFTGSGTPTTGQGVEVNAPDANTGQIASYDRGNTAYKELRVKGSSVGVYTGTTNALAGTFNSTGLTMESGKTITGVLATAAQTNITSLGTLSSLQISNHLGLGVAGAEFGSGVKTIVLQGGSSTKSGCIDFKENSSGTRLANIFVQNDTTYGLSIGTQCSGEDGDFIRFHTGTLASTKMLIKSDGDITTPAAGRLFVGGNGNPTNLEGVQYSKLLVDVANNADYIHFRKNVGQNQPILNITHNQDYLAAARYANSGDAWVTGVETSGNFIFSHGMGAAGGGGSTTLALDSSGSLVSKSSMFNHYNHLVCQGGSGGDAHKNYILVCKTTTIDARLAGEFVITRQAGASGIAISRIEANLIGNPSAADFRYQTRSMSTNGSYPGMYGQWVTVEFGGTTYYAIRLDPVAGSSRWASQPQHCYFKGTENNCVGNGLGTIIDSNANTIGTVTDLNDIQGHIVTKNSTVDLSGRLSVDASGRVIVGGGTHTGGAALVVKGDGNTPNSYAAAAFCKMGANPTSNTTLANLRFSGGAAGTNRAAEINVKTDSNWNDGTSQESKMEFTLAESGGGNTAGNPVMTLKGTGNVEVNRGELHIASKLVHDGDTDTNINFGTNTITINAGNRTAINCNSNMTEISSPVQYNNAREYTTSSNSTWQTICTFSTSTSGFSMECGVRENNYTTMHRVSGSANWNQCYFTADFAGDSNHGHSSDIEFRVIDNDKLQFKAVSHTTTRVLSVISIWTAQGYVTWA